MKKVILSFLLLATATAYAIPPLEQPTRHIAVSGNDTVFVYIAPKVLFDANADFFQYVATYPPDSTTLAQALQAYIESGTSAIPIYPVKFRNGQPKWAMFDGLGYLVTGDSIVGFNAPRSEMASVIWPRDRGLLSLRDENAVRHGEYVPVPREGIHGIVQFACLFVAASDMDTTLIIASEQGPRPVQVRAFWNILFTDSLPSESPRNHDYSQSVRRYMHDATNGYVDFRPDTTRWSNYDLPGILNPIDENGYLQPLRLNLTTDSLLHYQESYVLDQFIQPYADSLGINIETGDPYQPLAIIWMHSWYWAEGYMWPHAQMGEGRMTSGAYWQGWDLSPPGVIMHELGHCTYGFLDHYWSQDDSNMYDVMGRASYNDNGWTVPHYSSPDAHRHNWWPVHRLGSRNDLGVQWLSLDQSLYCENPYSVPNPVYPERLYYTVKKDTLGDAEIGFMSTRLAVWWTYWEPQWDPLQGEWDYIFRQRMVPADGDARTDQDGNVYPYAGIDSVVVAHWEQSSIEASVPVTFQLHDIAVVEEDSVEAGYFMSVNVTYVPAPLFAVNTDSIAPPQFGEDWMPQISVTNFGTFVDTLVVNVTSDRTDIIPNFQLHSTESIDTLCSSILISSQPVEISSNPNALGAIVALTYQFPNNSVFDTIYVELANASGNSFSQFTGPKVYNSRGSLVVVAAQWNAVDGYIDGNFEWHRALADTIREIAISEDGNRIGVTAHGSRIYQISASTGVVMHSWQLEGTALAKPEVMFTDGYITFIGEDVLYRYDENGLPPEYEEERSTVTLPLEPTEFCFGYDGTSQRFGLVTGDTTTMLGSFIIIDSVANVIFPETETIPVYNSAFLTPFAGDRNADGHLDFFAPYVSAIGGGTTFITYNGYNDTTTMEYTGFNLPPLLTGFGMSLNIGATGERARLISSYVSTNPVYNSLLYDGSSNTIRVGLPMEREWFTSSFSFDSTISNAVVLVLPYANQVCMYGQTGIGLYPNSTPIAATVRENALCGPPISMFNSIYNEWQELFPVESTNEWTFVGYRTFGNGSDWQGRNGTSTNTRCHYFRGAAPECERPDTVTLTITTLVDSLLLQWTACFDEQIIGYHVYAASTPNGTWTELTGLDITYRSEYSAWTVIPMSSLPSPSLSFYRVTAELATEE